VYDCRPYAGTANENCDLQGPGALYVSVHGYSAATVQLKVSYVGAAATDGGVDAGVRVDAGVIVDGGARPDAGVDAGVRLDAGITDAGVDAGVRPDAGVTDAGVSDGGVRPDAGVVTDAGVAHLAVNGSVAQGEMKVFSLPVTAGRLVVIRTVAPADVDLYAKLNSAPTTASYEARGYTSSGNETIRYTPTTSGVLYLGVHGYRASSFTLTTADQ
jgi:hypothetical protein